MLFVFQYVLEIKNRFILIFINGFSVILVTYLHKETILFIVIEPNLLINITKSLESFYFIFTDVTEVLLVYLRLVIFLSIQVLYIYSLYNLFIYLSPALSYSEYLFFRLFVNLIFSMWIIIGLLNTYFLIPLSWNFFLSFQSLTITESFILHFETKLKEYLMFYISFYYICEFYFQFFLFYLITLNYLKFNFKTTKKFRKIHYYSFIILSTVISPPDILSQVFVSLIFVFVFEVLILFFLIQKLVTEN